MNHSDIQSRMASYLDGELALGQRALFDAHLDGCEACSTELSDMRATINLLRRLPSPEPPADLVDQIMRRVAEGEGQATWWGRVGDTLATIFAPRITIPATALAAGLAITFISGDLQLRPLDPGASSGAPEIASIVSAVPSGLQNDAGQPATGRPGQVAIRVEMRMGANDESNPNWATQSAPRNGRAEDGSGATLYRVGSSSYRLANEPLGPLRRQPRDGTSTLFARGDALAGQPTTTFAGNGFATSAPARVGPYLGASAVDQRDLGIGVYQLRWAQRPETLTISRASATRPSLSARDHSESPRTDRRRDELNYRLRHLIQDPPGFAKSLAAVSLAERELWLQELAIRAEETGNFDRVKLALSSSGDPLAEEMAVGFVRSLKQRQATWAEAVVDSVP